MLKSLSIKNRYFLFPYFLFLVVGAFFLARFCKGDLHLLINRFHSHAFDLFFGWITFLGDGLFALAIGLALLAVRYRYALMVLLSWGISSGITQALKHFVFEGRVRPVLFFEGKTSLYLVPGIDMNSYYSFPSGHGTTAFAVYFCLALLSEKKGVKSALFVLTLLVAFSRVYLSQHFFEDIYFGSLVGMASTVFCYWLMTSVIKNDGLDNSLLRKRSNS